MNLSSTPAPPVRAEGHILQVETGLQQLMGDRALYLQILRRFRQRYQGSANQARIELIAGDVAGARHIFHTLKGAAGMIGAQQVYLLATALESDCTGPSESCLGPLAQLEQALRSLMTAIDTELNADDHVQREQQQQQQQQQQQGYQPQATTPGGPPETRMLVLHLARLLEEGDGAAIDVLEQSATVLAASLGVAVFQEVTEAAHQFDFEAALAVLQATKT
ncbi:MAG TPA: Hpt domain-containing protein [Duganella sp.]|jgi:two-component system sensor histidine kinase/response regulator